MVLVMDDQEILKMKKLYSGNKKRSSNSFSFSSSAKKEMCDPYQLMNGEKATVYALFEVSRNSERSTRREKIALGHRDVYQMLEKLVNVDKDRSCRRILKQTRRRFAAEYSDKDMVKAHDFFECSRNCNFDTSDKSNNLSNEHTVCYPLRDRELNFFSSANDECSDLKVLYSRNTIHNYSEKKSKNVKLNFVSKGTNTDIAQTPKLLDDVLKALNMNWDSSCEHPLEKAQGTGNENGDSGQKNESLCGIDDKERYHQSPKQNYILVPFIIASKHLETTKKCCSAESISNKDFKCRSVKNSQLLQELKENKSSLDVRSGLNSVNLHIDNGNDVRMQYMNGRYETEHERSRSDCRHRDQGRGESCFLEEVKSLQVKLDSIAKTLEMSNPSPCPHATGTVKGKNDENNWKCIEESSFSSVVFRPNWHHLQDFDSVQMILYNNPSQFQRHTSDSTYTNNSHDFCAQTSSMKSECTLTEAILVTKQMSDSDLKTRKDDIFLKKTKMVSELNQFPSEHEIGCPGRNRKLYSSKSASTSCIERAHFIRRPKKAVSTTSKEEGQSGDCLTLWMPKQDSRWNWNRAEEDRSTYFLYEKSETQTKLAERVLSAAQVKAKDPKVEREVGNKPKTGNVAKIRIVGNAILSDKHHRESGTINLHFDDTTNIKVTNKLMKKIQSNDGNESNVDSSAKNAGKTKKLEMKNDKKDGTGKKIDAILQKQPKVTDKKCQDSDGSKNGKFRRLEVRNKEPEVCPRAAPSKRRIPVKSQQEMKKLPREKPVSATGKTEKKVNQIEESGNVVQVAKQEMKNLISNDYRKSIGESAKSEVPKDSPQMTEGAPISKQSQAVKSIWALTKVILYQDGSQSFEVLEASSYPLGYRLDEIKKMNDALELKAEENKNSAEPSNNDKNYSFDRKAR